VTAGPTETAGSQVGQAARSLAIRFCLSVLGAATGVVLARALHPEGRGTYGTVVTVATTATILGHLSLDQAYVALWRGRRDALAANSVLLGPVLGMSAALIAGLIAATGVVGAASPGMIVVALLAVPFTTTAYHLTSVLVLDSRVGAVDSATLFGGVLLCGGLLALSSTQWLTVERAVWIWTVTSALPLLLLLAAARPRLRDRDPALARRSLSLSSRYHVGSTALYLSNGSGILILGVLMTPAAVGLYVLAVGVAEMMSLPTEILARMVLSRQAAGDLASAADATIRATRVSTLLAAASVGSLCLAAPVLVPLAYGAAFGGSVAALLALAPGVLAIGAGRQIAAYLLRLNRPFTMSALPVGTLAVNVALSLILIPRWGVVGCSLASSVSCVLMVVVQVARFSRATSTPARRLLPGVADLALVRRWVLRPNAAKPARCGDC
jgi:O-antigen/teichoic acid export membrane protein